MKKIISIIETIIIAILAISIGVLRTDITQCISVVDDAQGFASSSLQLENRNGFESLYNFAASCTTPLELIKLAGQTTIRCDERKDAPRIQDEEIEIAPDNNL